MPTTRTEPITATDGSGTFAGTVTLPDAGSGPGLLLLHEIFGVNDYIVDLGRRLAELGYVSLAPDLFWRQEPGVHLGIGDDDLARGMQLGQAFDPGTGVEDVLASLDHLRGLPEITGRVGVIGFCFGGVMAYLTAAHGGPDAAVSYYGSGVPDLLGLADRITCPVLFHFGGSDPYLPRDEAERVAETFAGRVDADVHLHDGAGHAFDNWTNPRFSQPEPAAAAWETTAAFLARHLPTT
jgi:carboxymethylenebutenolidase